MKEYISYKTFASWLIGLFALIVTISMAAGSKAAEHETKIQYIEKQLNEKLDKIDAKMEFIIKCLEK